MSSKVKVSSPVVSVVVLNYNKEPFIRKCLDSILCQETSFPFELLIGEDDSTDGSKEICMTYAEKHPDKIRLFLHKEEDKIEVLGRKSMHNNFLQTLKHVEGKYIAYCDGDDYWTDSNKLQKQFEALESDPKLSLTYHNCIIVDENDNQLGQKLFYKQGRFSFEDSLQHKIGPASSLFVRAEVLDKFKFDQYILDLIFQDWVFELLGLSLGKGYFDPTNMGAYRISSEAAHTLGGQESHIQMRINLLSTILRLDSIPEQKINIKSALLRWQMRKANHLIKNGLFPSGIKAWIKSMRNIQMVGSNIKWMDNLSLKTMYYSLMRYRIWQGIKSIFLRRTIR